VRKADRHHRARTALGQSLCRLLALRGVGDLELQIVLAAGALPALGTGERRLAEGLVALAAGLVDERRLGRCRGRGQRERGGGEGVLQKLALN
jgi:hypothetical protein